MGKSRASDKKLRDLRVLDLHENDLISLPDSLGQLKSLLSLGGFYSGTPVLGWSNPIPNIIWPIREGKIKDTNASWSSFLAFVWGLSFMLFPLLTFTMLLYFAVLYGFLVTIWRSYD